MTILPHETGLRHGLRLCLRRITLGALVNPRELRSDRPPGLLPYSSDAERIQENVDDDDAILSHALDRLQSHIQDDELADAAEAQAHGDPSCATRTCTTTCSCASSRASCATCRTTPDRKRYSYRDWMWFLKLLGQDETDANSAPGAARAARAAEHAAAPARRRSGGRAGPADGAGAGPRRRRLRRPRGRRRAVELARRALAADERQVGAAVAQAARRGSSAR